MHIDCVGRRGCYRTALELSKFMLALSPEKDPMGGLFLAEYYCLRSKKVRRKQLDYLFKLACEFGSEFPEGGCLLSYPNVLFSIALGKAIKDVREGRELRCDVTLTENILNVSSLKELVQLESGAVLLAATLCFPGVYQKLLKKISPSEQFEAEFDSPLGDYTKIAEIYAERCGDMWKPEPFMPWLKKSSRIAEELEDLRPHLQAMLDTKANYARYMRLDKSQFSDDVRNWIPEDVNIGVPRRQPNPQGNVMSEDEALWLLLSTLPPVQRDVAPED